MKENHRLYSPTTLHDTLQADNLGGWQRWLISKPLDWLSSAFYLVNILLFLVNYLFNHPERQPNFWWQFLLVVGAMLGLALLDRSEILIFHENFSLRNASILTSSRVAILLLVSLVTDDGNTFFFGSIIVMITVAQYFGMWGTYLAGFILICVAALLFINTEGMDTSTFWSQIILALLLLIIVFTFAKMMLAEKELRTKAERLVAALDESQHQIARLAVIEERNRLARDIHDSLGHYLTVVNVQLEKAQAFREVNPAEADKAVTSARQLANEALEEVRRSVGTLRVIPETFSLTQALTRLVENSQSHLLKIDLEIRGSEAGYSDEVLTIIYRAVQEGLTNIQRHAQASYTKINLEFSPAQIQLTIADNGKGFELEQAGGNSRTGYGLAGLRERLAAIGGTLRLDSRPDAGTKLEVIIPRLEFLQVKKSLRKLRN